LKKHFPIVDWLPSYKGANFRPDIFAALAVWAIVVPESMAYASIAGMPPETGLYAATAPLLAYVIFGTSKRMTVGPSSAAAAVSASTIFPLSQGDPARFVQLSIMLALLAGVLLILGGLLKFGAVAKFLSGPVLTGFLVGVALDIALGQSEKLFGIELEGRGFFTEAWSLITQISEAHGLTVLVGFGSLAFLWVAHRFLPKLPAALFLVVAAIGITVLLGLESLGLEVAGDIPGGLPQIGLPDIAAGDIALLIPGALAISLVGFGETIAVAQSFGRKHGETVDPDQEMLAIGTSNVAGGLTGAFFANGSTSRTAAGDSAGQQTQMSGVVVVALLVVTMLVLTPLFHSLPEATLGAIVIHAVWHLISSEEFVRLWRTYRSDSIAAIGTLLGVLVVGVLPGLAIGVAISLVALMGRAISPNTARLAFDESAQLYLDIDEHPELTPPEGIEIVRFDAPLFFANIDALRDAVEQAAAEPGVHAVVIDARGITDIDTTAHEGLKELRQDLESRGLTIEVAQVREFLIPKIENFDPGATERIFPSVRSAVEHIQTRDNSRHSD
jgi:high affinity sulfate transporter 1